MCGIVGLYLKTPKYAEDLGRLSAGMLHEMRERGPDSAGFAVYGTAEDSDKLVLLSTTGETDWKSLVGAMGKALSMAAEAEPISDHAVLRIDGEGRAARRWRRSAPPTVRWTSRSSRPCCSS